MRLELKLPCLWRQDVKDRRVIIGILPCVVVTSLERDAHMAIVAYFGMLMVRRNPARGREKKVLKEQLLFWGNQKSKVVYLKTQIQWILFFGKLENLGLNASVGHIMKFSGRTWYVTKIREETWRHYPKRWTSRAKSLRVQFWGTNTWGNLPTRSLCQQSSVEFG